MHEREVEAGGATGHLAELPPLRSHDTNRRTYKATVSIDILLTEPISP